MSFENTTALQLEKAVFCGFAERVRSYSPAPRQESWGSRRELQESNNMASSRIQGRRKEPARDPKAAPRAKRDSGAFSGPTGLPAPFRPFSEVSGRQKKAPRVAKNDSSQALGGHVSRHPMGAWRRSEGLAPRSSSELIRRPRRPDGLRPRARRPEGLPLISSDALGNSKDRHCRPPGGAKDLDPRGGFRGAPRVRLQRGSEEFRVFDCSVVMFRRCLMFVAVVCRLCLVLLLLLFSEPPPEAWTSPGRVKCPELVLALVPLGPFQAFRGGRDTSRCIYMCRAIL